MTDRFSQLGRTGAHGIASRRATGTAPLPTRSIPNELIVELDPRDRWSAPTIADLLRHYPVEAYCPLWRPNVLHVRLVEGIDPRPVLSALRRDPRVQSASGNERTTLQQRPDDPLYEEQWNLDAVNVEPAWRITRGTNDITVAILDSGIVLDDRGEIDHPDWRRRGNVLLGQNFSWGATSIHDGTASSHGTHVAGIVGAQSNNEEGIAGIDQRSTIMILKVFGDEMTGTTAALVGAIYYAVDNGADVINWSGSLCDGEERPYLETAIHYAMEHSVFFVFPSGNIDDDCRSSNDVAYPASLAEGVHAITTAEGEEIETTFPNVIAVSSTDEANELAPSTKFGPAVTVAAPGEDILSTVAGPRHYASGSGTSNAAPHVAGLLSLLLSLAPDLSFEEVRTLLRENSTDLGTAERDEVFGFGLIDIGATVEALASWIDTDGDGTNDLEDNCRLIENEDQGDVNGNGVGDACEAPILPPLLKRKPVLYLKDRPLRWIPVSDK